MIVRMVVCKCVMVWQFYLMCFLELFIICVIFADSMVWKIITVTRVIHGDRES